MTFEEWWENQNAWHYHKDTAHAAWKAAQEVDRERAKELVDELKNIMNARPREWGEGLKDHFEWWAKNRARAAITKYEESR
jgi:hypothetical protein